MKIAVWKTGHEIADTVADALAEGLNGKVYSASDCRLLPIADYHIGYGILRGVADIFRMADKEKIPVTWFNVDRGYFNPSHYDGYYRISYRGTQAKWHDGIPRKPWSGNLEPWRGFNSTKPVLLCPPTEHVAKFFRLKYNADKLAATDWEHEHLQNAFKRGQGVTVRQKGSTAPIQWDEYSAVITFNSSVGWQALQKGIPVISDPQHSIIGSHYKHYGLNSLTDFSQYMVDTRLELFEAMNAHQFTLDEIKRGEAWPLIIHYLQNHTKSSSAMTPANPSAPMFARIR
jgi:hypothetical protein